MSKGEDGVETTLLHARQSTVGLAWRSGAELSSAAGTRSDDAHSMDAAGGLRIESH